MPKRKKPVYTATWMIAHCCGASTGVSGHYTVEGRAKSRSLHRAMAQAKKRANAQVAQAYREASSEVQYAATCTVDDGHAEIPGDLSQYWTDENYGRGIQRRTRSPRLIAQIIDRRLSRAA